VRLPPHSESSELPGGKGNVERGRQPSVSCRSSSTLQIGSGPPPIVLATQLEWTSGRPPGPPPPSGPPPFQCIPATRSPPVTQLMLHATVSIFTSGGNSAHALSAWPALLTAGPTQADVGARPALSWGPSSPLSGPKFPVLGRAGGGGWTWRGGGRQGSGRASLAGGLMSLICTGQPFVEGQPAHPADWSFA